MLVTRAALALVLATSIASAENLPKVDYDALDGTKYTAASLTDKVVVVHFWATWTRPALKMIPALAAIHARYKDRCVVVLAIATDDVADASKLGITYPVVRATDAISAAFHHPANLPTTFVYDHGRLATSQIGAMTEATLDTMVAGAHPCEAVTGDSLVGARVVGVSGGRVALGDAGGIVIANLGGALEGKSVVRLPRGDDTQLASFHAIPIRAPGDLTGIEVAAVASGKDTIVRATIGGAPVGAATARETDATLAGVALVPGTMSFVYAQLRARDGKRTWLVIPVARLP